MNNRKYKKELKRRESFKSRSYSKSLCCRIFKAGGFQHTIGDGTGANCQFLGRTKGEQCWGQVKLCDPGNWPDGCFHHRCEGHYYNSFEPKKHLYMKEPHGQ